MRILAMVLLALTLLASVSRAWAQVDEKDEAKRHFDIGIGLISGETKDYAAALVEFQESVRLFPTKSGLYNLGLCFRRLSRYGDALEVLGRLEREFAETIDDTMRQDVSWEVEAIRKLTVELTIRVEPPGATISLNGEPLGSSPLAKPLILGPREYRIQVELGGYENVDRRLVLVAGQRHVETIQMAPLAAKLMVATEGLSGAIVWIDGQRAGSTPLAAPLSVPPGDHLVTVTKDGYLAPATQSIRLLPGGAASVAFPPMEPVSRPPTKPPATRSGSNALASLPWIGAALTVTGGICAGVLWNAASQHYDDFSSYDDQIATGAVAANSRDAADVVAQRQSAADDVGQYRDAAIGVTVAASALAVTTVVLFLLDVGGAPSRPLELSASRGGMGVRF